MTSKNKLLVAIVATALGASATQAITIDLNPVADTFVGLRPGTGAGGNSNFGTSTDLDIHQQGDISMYAYVRFDLSALGANAVINSATITFTQAATNTLEAGYPLGSVRNDSTNTGRFALYGLLDVDGNTAQNWGETTLTYNLVGGERINNGDTGLQFDTTTRTISFDGINETVSAGVAKVTGPDSSSVFVGFIQDRLDANNFGGLATFIIDHVSNDNRGSALISREGVGAIPVLTIDYTPGAAIPEPSAFAALAGIVGLGFAASRRRRSA